MGLDTGEREFISLKHLRLAVAQHLKLNVGELGEIHAPDNNTLDGRVGRIAAVKEHNVEVWLRDVRTVTMYNYNLKPQQLTPLLLEREPQTIEIGARLDKLRSFSLDPFEREILLMLERPLVLIQTEWDYFCHMEKRYGIVKNSGDFG